MDHQLNGLYCQEITSYNKKVGTFINGKFLSGVYTDRELTLSGEFKYGMLHTGTKTTKDATYEGTFSNGYLSETWSYENWTY